MEKIKIYRPHSMLIKATAKIIKAIKPLKSRGEYVYCDERKPKKRATAINDMMNNKNRINKIVL